MFNHSINTDVRVTLNTNETRYQIRELLLEYGYNVKGCNEWGANLAESDTVLQEFRPTLWVDTSLQPIREPSSSDILRGYVTKRNSVLKSAKTRPRKNKRVTVSKSQQATKPHTMVNMSNESADTPSSVLAEPISEQLNCIQTVITSVQIKTIRIQRAVNSVAPVVRGEISAIPDTQEEHIKHNSDESSYSDHGYVILPQLTSVSQRIPPKPKRAEQNEKKKLGRPKKIRPVITVSASDSATGTQSELSQQGEKRKRGRPKKIRTESTVLVPSSTSISRSVPSESRKRGRPRTDSSATRTSSNDSFEWLEGASEEELYIVKQTNRTAACSQ